MALALATGYGQGVFAIEVEVCRQRSTSFIGGMMPSIAEPTCFGVAEAANPVAEDLHAPAERLGNDPVEWLVRLSFNATVDNLQVIQFEFEFDLGQDVPAVAVQAGHLGLGNRMATRHPACH